MPWQQWQHNLEVDNRYNHLLIMAVIINFLWFLYRSSLSAGMEWIYRQQGVPLGSKAWNNHLYIMIWIVISLSINHPWIRPNHFSLTKKITYPLTKLIGLETKRLDLILDGIKIHHRFKTPRVKRLDLKMQILLIMSFLTGPKTSGWRIPLIEGNKQKISCRRDGRKLER